ncbi:MAG TPA: PrgI family protein [Candidatus Paceibacterota bacterium]|nr:PrgI family protein [Candidatus Paceibacterota bacterium]
MRFEVPQFIDIQDKIFGPLTFKQFIYVAGGGGLCFAIYKLLPIYFAIPIMLAIAALAWALAFYKLNGQAFITIGQAFLVYITKNKLYVWKREPKKNPVSPIQTPEITTQKTTEEPMTARRIQDLARNLDILDKTRYN